MFTKSITSLTLAIVCAVVIGTTAAPHQADALGTSWTDVVASHMALMNAFGPVTNDSVEMFNPTVTIQYRAFVKNAETGEIIPPNGTVTVGTPLELVCDEHTYEDAYWFATGGHMDTPYGEWRTNAEPPAAISCESKDYFYRKNYRNGNATLINGDLYSPFVVNPPACNIATNAVLSCDPKSGRTQDCVAAAPGTAPVSFRYEDTFAKFYIRMIPLANVRERVGGGRIPQYNTVLQKGMCYGSNEPMYKASVNRLMNGNRSVLDRQVAIPAQTIPYPINVIAAPDENLTPNDPAVGNAAGSCEIGSPHNINITSTDPDGDQIRYAYEWDNTGVIMYAPVSGYVNSGQTLTISKTYALSGGKSVRVRTIDEHGLASAWTTFTFDCDEPPQNNPSGGNPPTAQNPQPPQNGQCIDIRASRPIVRVGDEVELEWDICPQQNPAECVIVSPDNGREPIANPSGRRNTAVLGTSQFQLICPNETDRVNVFVLPRVQET